MPNTPALIGHGVSGLFASDNCRAHHREQAESILRTAGEVVWVKEEALIDVVTAVSGSGPAYYFLMTEALATAGQQLGLDEHDAKLLAVRTAEGAGAMMVRSEDEPGKLRERVTSPGGTTQAALESMEANGFRSLIRAAVEAATIAVGSWRADDRFNIQAFSYLIGTLIDLYVAAILLRLLLQWVRADFYNPLCQFLVKVTNPVVIPFRRFVPSIGPIDTASIVVMLLLQAIGVFIITRLAISTWRLCRFSSTPVSSW